MAFRKSRNLRVFYEDRTASPSRSRLILLVNESEDEDVEQVVGVCLKHIAGWVVISMSSMDIELLSLLNIQPDAILFNTRLSQEPDLSPKQTQTIQQLQQYSSVAFSPILLLIDTAHWLAPEHLQLLGVTGAIAKPFDPATLPESISQLLGWN